MIKVTLPNDDVLVFEDKITILDISRKISPSLSKKMLYAYSNNEVVSPLKENKTDFSLKIITDENDDSFSSDLINKQTSFFLSDFLIEKKYATKIKKRGSYDDGFFVEFFIEKSISEKQLEKINNEFKKYLLKLNPSVSMLILPSKIKNIDLRGISGTSFGGNRIFGFSSFSAEGYEKKKLEFENRKERDHRKIGKELELFFFDHNSAKGFPFWLPNGLTLKNTISNFIKSQEIKYGFSHIETPIIGSKKMYEISGHYSHYRDNMFPEMVIEENEIMMIRPMSCPHHCKVYSYKKRSYNELPIRYAEEVFQYRYEHSGSLIGLERVRGMQLTDSHIFLTPNQIKDEIKNSFDLIITTLNKFKIKIDYIELAVHDPNKKDKYHGDINLWSKSEKILEEFLKENKVKYIKKEGEAAFYGPKIDIQIKTALGHNITVSTLQLDYLLPEKFNLKYIDSDGSEKQPIMIHRGLIGTYERFISILLEQTKGNLPMWLAPKQAVIIPVNNKYHIDYSRVIFDLLSRNNIRVSIDDSNERLANKIRIHQKNKIKTQIIIGDEEVENESVSLRFYGTDKEKKISKSDLLKEYND